MTADLQAITDKIARSERLTRDDGLELMRCGNLPLLSHLADRVRQRLHPENIVTYIVDRNINYTNICTAGCRFCAFHRKPGQPGGYVLDRETFGRKIDETLALGGVQILLQGGLNPGLHIEWFEDLFRWIKQEHPIHIHGLSPAEIQYIARISGIGIRETLERLMAAGLDSIPGGGAEILVDRVRKAVNAHVKTTTDGWVNVMREAHGLGMKTTATMMFGSVESVEDRIEHMLVLRKLQDETGGFTAFIPWTYQPENTELGGEKATSYEYLKTLAVSRLMLDNIPNLQASWVTQGGRIGELALRCGCNDFGSTMIEENVVAAAGVRFSMSAEDIEKIIRQAGLIPARRNQAYEILKTA